MYVPPLISEEKLFKNYKFLLSKHYMVHVFTVFTFVHVCNITDDWW